VAVELGVVEQRYRAVLEVLDEGVPVTVVARRYGVARQTVHEWLARYANGGGLANRSPRPLACPHQTSAVVEAQAGIARFCGSLAVPGKRCARLRAGIGQRTRCFVDASGERYDRASAAGVATWKTTVCGQTCGPGRGGGKRRWSPVTLNVRPGHHLPPSPGRIVSVDLARGEDDDRDELATQGGGLLASRHGRFPHSGG